jgi:vesicle coat complex subunit
MQTEDLEQKKLVYLYLMNYAKTQPELVILAVNTFVKVRLSSTLSLSIKVYD